MGTGAVASSASVAVASQRSALLVVIPVAGVIVAEEVMTGGVLITVTTRVALSVPESVSVAVARHATLSPGLTFAGSRVSPAPVPSEVVLFLIHS